MTSPAAQVPEDVRLAAGELEVTVRPAFGAQISSLRRRGRELLDQGRRRGASCVPADFVSGGLGGIDDCLPAVAPGVHPTLGVPIPDHGELWYRPVEVVGRGERELEVRAAGEELPFTLLRRIALSEEALRVEYEIEHTRDGELPVLWAAHPLLQTSPGMRIELPGKLDRLYAASGVELGSDGRLLTAAGGSEPGDWEALPRGACAKLFGPWVGPVSVVHPAWELAVEVDLEAPRPAQLGLWLNHLGFPADSPACHVAVEPSFGDGDDFDGSLANRTCLILGPRERVAWAVTYTVSASLGPVLRPTP